MNKTNFLHNLQADNNDNHRLLLWYALKETKGNIVEFGSGWGSTEYLRKYAKDSRREFMSFDNGEEWAKKHDSTFVPNNDWGSIDVSGGVILIDHAPGERRYEDIQRLKDEFDIIVMHDSEPTGAGDYRYEKIWHLFKYRADVKTNGAWASMVSNTIDVTKFKGNSFEQFAIS